MFFSFMEWHLTSYIVKNTANILFVKLDSHTSKIINNVISSLQILFALG